jgi:uncharacterized protein YecE (DUF72 family)
MPRAARRSKRDPAARILIGCAGWSVPRAEQAEFAPGASHLVRYASRLPAAEINSSFYRPHRPSTYARWAASVPPDFRFSVKVPKRITHERRLVDAEPLLDAFLAEAGALGDRLGCLLVQLPPSLRYDVEVAEPFLGALRERTTVDVACEPRHASWFAGEADALLAAHRVARVAADPARAAGAEAPGGWPGLRYYRLHGSPRIYYSAYDAAYLDALAVHVAGHAAAGERAWCIFDNTAHGAAARNALDLATRLGVTGQGSAAGG